jgi:hypothetical protein
MILARETLNCKEIVVFEVADGTHSREPGKVVFSNNLKTASVALEFVRILQCFGSESSIEIPREHFIDTGTTVN